MPGINKKCEEFEEAAIVLPLVILTILSMITVAVFLFRYEMSQSEAHQSVGRESAGSDQVFGIKKKTASMSGTARGIFREHLEKGKEIRMYVISQADAVMLGELAE